MEMKSIRILIVDDNTIRRMNIVDRISGVCPKAEVHHTENPHWPDPAPNGRADLVLFHWNNYDTIYQDSDSEFQIAIDDAKVQLAYSKAGFSNKQKLPEKWLPIMRQITESQNLTKNEWKELLTWVAKEKPLEVSKDSFPKALWNDFPRIAVALLVLCQGFLAMDSGEIPSDTADDENIVRTVEWWAKPFRPISGDLTERLKKELDCEYLPDEMKELVNWFRKLDTNSNNGNQEKTPENLVDCVKKTKEYLTEQLDSNSISI